jgi:phosphatidylglycerophosphatase A
MENVESIEEKKNSELNTPNSTLQKRVKKFILFWATGFGVGYSPLAPGTLGTLISIPVY